jgi:hypothetical protein
MSEERQRQVREQGSRPGEAERQHEAQTSREAREQSEASQRADLENGSTDEPTPLAEDHEDRPTPRR